MTETEDRRWLREGLSATVQGLSLKPALLKEKALKRVLADVDDDALFQLAAPLSLTKPLKASEQLRQIGGPRFLTSDAGQAAIAAWGTAHGAAAVLNELWKTIGVVLAAYNRGVLADIHPALRALPVLAMSAFSAEGERLRQELAVVLGSQSWDTPALLRSYGRAVQLGNGAILAAVDRRIMADPSWGPWASGFARKGMELAKTPQAVSHWMFPESPLPSTENTVTIRSWLFRRR